MTEIEIVYQIGSTGLIFLLFATGIWKKSISNTIHIIAVTIGFYCALAGCLTAGVYVILASGLIAALITMFRDEVDPLLKDYVND